jgi:UDP-galactose transporter B1
MLSHKAILIDNILIGVLCFVGQIFIYRMVKQFKQHIVPFIITTRKIFTVALSIIVYGHRFNIEQMVGVALVFGASFWEFVS